MNRGLATLVASLAMMDPDGLPPLLTRAERCAEPEPPRDDGAADRKRARKAARRLRERDATVAGREESRAWLRMREFARHVRPGASVDFVWES